jgi:hypothetical protein
VYPCSLKYAWSKRSSYSNPRDLPDITDGITNMGGPPPPFLLSLSVARIAPDNNLNGSASIGLTGAGSNAVPQASEISTLMIAPRSRMVLPKAMKVMLFAIAKSLMSEV